MIVTFPALMYNIQKVAIEGLWGLKDFSCDFDLSCNFLIGKNGCGKTTIINLISAALNLDFATLEGTDFKSIDLKFISKKSKNKPELKVIKERDSDNLFSEIKFLIRHKSTEEFKQFDLNDADQRILMQRKLTLWRNNQGSRVSELGIATELRKIIRVTWLPIHRHLSGNNQELPNREFSTPIDAKINDLSNRLVRYFSSLGSAVKKLEEKVQKTMFLSLLAPKSYADENEGISLEMLNKEQEGLTQIFKNFNISETDYLARLENHFRLAEKTFHMIKDHKESAINERQYPDMEALSAFLATMRIGYVVKEWNEFQEKQKEILRGRDDFLEMLNHLIDTKSFSLSASNELFVTLKYCRTEKSELPLFKLSSGEKQLLIILGEALLQNSETTIYIADEPELSLHVDWQESLVTNIKKLNPNSQIIFATHSPDIVSTYDSAVRDISDLLK